MSNRVIAVENLGKKYIIGHQKKERYGTLRDTISQGILSLGKQLIQPWNSQAIEQNFEEFWALKDVSFEVKQGDRIGIIGRNGAGKSTLLKILSRITEPTTGRIKLEGRVASLLEVGTGFHPELTGRENIFLNGAILGMSKGEIKRKFDEIVAFAEVEKFLDTPVKRYSSGMYVRLAFAVAAHLEPEILVVDEVLAVGDVGFQKKCLGKMEDVGKEGRTVLFVSHNMTAIQNLCKWVILLDGGRIEKKGLTHDVISHYFVAGNTRSNEWVCCPDSNQNKDLQFKLTSSRILQHQNSASLVDFDVGFDIEVDYQVLKSIDCVSILIRIKDSLGNIILTSWDSDSIEGSDRTRTPGCYQSVCRIPKFLLRPGQYSVTIGAHIPDVKILDFYEDILSFQVSSCGYTLNLKRQGLITPILEWQTLSF